MLRRCHFVIGRKTMKRTIIILATLLLVSACAFNGQHSSSAKPSGKCDGSKGATTTNVFYGDGELRITPISRIKANSEFRFKLKPNDKKTDRFDYKSVDVEIKFKPDDESDSAEFIDIKGSSAKATDSTLIVCVPADAAKGDVYEFFINVDEVGKLDPRAEVY